ncbi:hypothetical protein C8A00DRAFT_35738 [Chaetomidium leptoderma]|uniref:Oxidase ustYa n=1 Tax=Chaetomidium leptoderma TaxID=669021 RepID=A0AAN6VJZ5_9PEZI|nr:hypothetical protein C8A00DRAFT_35738 [Chaetomidium leptoderma]
MDLDTARYSIDIASPMTPNSKSEQEEAGLLPSDDALFGLEEPGQVRRARNIWRWKRILNPLLALLALFSSLLAVAGWIMYWRALPGLHLVGEINGLVPEFPVRPVLFDDDPRSTPDHKTAESANATYDYWVSFMPLGNGFMAVDHDPKHILPPPMVDKGPEFYSIAVFHQLHCLHSVMKMWNKVNDDLELAKRGELQHREEAHHPDLRRHIDHCFRYLRQSIVCCADTALEGQNLKAKIPDTDGTGATHLCKDFEQVRAWAQERRLDDGHAI